MTDDVFTSGLPTTRTDPDALVDQMYAIPAVPSEVYQHAGRFMGAAVASVFEQIGGVSRMAQWADTNPTDFYTKVMPKMITRASTVEVSGQLSIDDALSHLENVSPGIIEGAATKVSEYDL